MVVPVVIAAAEDTMKMDKQVMMDLCVHQEGRKDFQQGLNQLMGVLEAFNIDREEAARSANLSEVMQEVSKVLNIKRG